MAEQTSFNVCDFIATATTKIDDMKSLSVNLILLLFSVCTCQPVSFLLDHFNVKALSEVFLSSEVCLSLKDTDLEMIFGDYGKLLPSSYSSN